MSVGPADDDRLIAPSRQDRASYSLHYLLGCSSGSLPDHVSEGIVPASQKSCTHGSGRKDLHHGPGRRLDRGPRLANRHARDSLDLRSQRLGRILKQLAVETPPGRSAPSVVRAATSLPPRVTRVA